MTDEAICAVRMPVFMPPEGAPKVAQAIVGVMKDIESVPKSGTNTEHKYKFVEATVLTARVQDAMLKNKLVLSPREIRRAITGGILFMSFEFDAYCEEQAILNIASYSASCRFAFKNGSFDDKASAKCLTSASKCINIALFKIPADVDDIERDREDYAPAPPSVTPPPPPEGYAAVPSEADAAAVDGKTFRTVLRAAMTRSEANQIWLANKATIYALPEQIYAVVYDDYRDRWDADPPPFP